MILKRIILENIRSYESADLQFKKGKTLLAGDIGSGKTTILIAIEFALFGLQPGQKASYILRNNAEKGKVILEFEIDGKNVVIERTLKRSKTISQEKVIVKFNNQIQELAPSQAKNFVISLLNYPREFEKKENTLYKYTVYTPQEEMKQIIFEKPEERLNVLRHVFGIDKYKRISQNLAIITRKLREESRILEVQTQYLPSLEKERAALSEKLSLIESYLPKLNSQIAEAESDFNLKKSLLSEVEEKIKEKIRIESLIEKNKELKKSMKSLLDSISSEIEQLSKKISQSEQIIFDLEKIKSIENSIKEITEQLEEKNKKYLETISNIRILESDKQKLLLKESNLLKLNQCPTCYQHVTSDYKKKISEDILLETNEINKKIGELKLIESSLALELKKIKEAKESQIQEKSNMEILKIKKQALEENRKRLETLMAQKQKIESEIILIEQSLLQLNSSISTYKEVSTQFSEISKRLEESRAVLHSLQTKRQVSLKERDILEESIKKINLEIESKKSLILEMNKIKEIESWLSEKFSFLVLLIEKNVLSKLRFEFSKLFSEWFSVLVPETLTARLNEDFTPIIESSGYVQEYGQLSGGEKTAVALAYRLALNQTINSFLSQIKTKDLIILDEPTDGFSIQQLDKMKDVLKQLSISQMIIVSHEPKIEEYVEHIIYLKKDSGNSLVIEKSL